MAASSICSAASAGSTAAALVAMPEKKLRGAGLSQNKMLAVKDLAAKTLDGTVPTLAKLNQMDDAEILERLTAVRGIGPWTVEMLLIFRLGRPDVLPVSDFGVRQGLHAHVPQDRAADAQGTAGPRRALAAVSLGGELVHVARRRSGAEREGQRKGVEVEK